MALFAPLAEAHEGEAHNDAAPPPSITATTPRASATTEEFELVTVVEQQRLILFVDIFATNEPATGAKIEIEGDGVKGLATQIEPGVYAVPAGVWARPGKHALTVSVQSGDAADLLPVTLDIAAPITAHSTTPRPWKRWLPWGGALLLVVTVGVLFALRRRPPPRVQTS